MYNEVWNFAWKDFRIEIVWSYNMDFYGNLVLRFSCGRLKKIMHFDVEMEIKVNLLKKLWARRSFKSLWSFTCWLLKCLWRLSLADSKDFEVCYVEMWSSREECVLLSGGKLIRVAEITVTWATCVWVRWYIYVVPSSKCWTIGALALNGILLIFYKRHFTRCHSLRIHDAKQEWLWTV